MLPWDREGQGLPHTHFTDRIIENWSSFVDEENKKVEGQLVLILHPSLNLYPCHSLIVGSV